MFYLAGMAFIDKDFAARNCIISADFIVKVSDFSLTKQLLDSNYYTPKNQRPVPIKWLAIESLLDNIYSVRSDAWSFGVLFWELLTRGSEPYS